MTLRPRKPRVTAIVPVFTARETPGNIVDCSSKGFDDTAEGGDVGVDPVVTVLDFDGFGQVKLDFADRPEPVAGLADIGSVALLLLSREIKVTARRCGFGGRSDGGPVYDPVTL
jgi:hypothetical protein